MPSLGCALLNHLHHRYLDDGDASVLEVDIDDSIRGPGGSVHGGIIGALADVAGSYAIYRAVARPAASTALAVQFLAPGRAGPIHARASVLRISRAFGVAEVRVVDRGNGDRLMAVATVTITFLDGDTWKEGTDG